MKMKYDESDNTLIRASRAVTDRVTDFLGIAHILFCIDVSVCLSVYYNNITFQLPTYLLCWLSGGLFSKTEMSEVLTEIVKADPTFDKDSFLKQCEKDIIPNILEVILLFLLSILANWLLQYVYYLTAIMGKMIYFNP